MSYLCCLFSFFDVHFRYQFFNSLLFIIVVLFANLIYDQFSPYPLYYNYKEFINEFCFFEKIILLQFFYQFKINYIHLNHSLLFKSQMILDTKYPI